MNKTPPIPIETLSRSSAVLYALGAVISFHAAYQFPALAWLMAVFLFCIFQLTKVSKAKHAGRIGMLVGLACYAPRLAFFWTLFGAGAIALWWILAMWLGLFVFLGRLGAGKVGSRIWAALAPFVWTGLEYVRSELYYLRFSWLSPGYAFSGSPALSFMAGFGTYGIGFLLMGWAAYFATAKLLSRAAGITFGVLLGLLSAVPFCIAPFAPANEGHVKLAGMQMEGSSEAQVLRGLDSLLKNYPDTDLFVLSELSFVGPLPKEATDWCQQHKKFLAVGAEDPVDEKHFFNTVFVVGPDGKIVFQQGKCVPVQFMNDGMPAREQRVWDSPWGKLGFGICYDASYTRVTDELERLGAQGFIFPTMDVAEWGKAQHDMHARIPPMRAAEYNLPFFRLCSSGISEYVGRDGRVLASAPFIGGQGKTLVADMKLAGHGRMPLDRPLAQLSVAIVGALVLFLILEPIIGIHNPRR